MQYNLAQTPINFACFLIRTPPAGGGVVCRGPSRPIFSRAVRAPPHNSSAHLHRRTNSATSMVFSGSSLTMGPTFAVSSRSVSKLASSKSYLMGQACGSAPCVAKERAQFYVAADKMKTRKSAAKRYKVTSSGKVRGRHETKSAGDP